MTMIALEDGSYVNSDAVHSIRWGSRDADGNERSKLTMRTGDREREYHAYGEPSEIADLINSNPAILMSEPGYVLLTVDDIREDEFNFGREAIIAWKFIRNDMPWPLTLSLDDRKVKDTPRAILCPDGAVVYQWVQNYESLEEWETAAREEWTKAKEYQARAKLWVVKEST